MKHAVAKELAELVLRQVSELQIFAERMNELEEPAEAKRYRIAVASVQGEMLLEVLRPIFAEHPDLTPPEMK